MKKLIKEEWVLNKTIGSFIKEEVKIPDSRAEKLANLFDEGCEVAYVARYRKDVHNGMECDDIRKAFEIYKETRDLNKKVVSAVNSVVPKIENVYESQNVKDMLKACSDIGEVSEITKMYTGGGRKNKVALAKEKGYETYAQEILSGKFVDLEILSTRKAVPQDEIEENIVIIMADLLNKMESTVKAVNEISKLENQRLKMSLTTAISSKANKNADDKSIEDAKLHFDNYIGFNKQVRQITENQILAMERAEDLGLITIKIEIDLNEAKLVHPYTKEVAGKIHGKMKEIFEKAVIYTVSKFFVPRIQRATRRHLSNKAQNAAIQCFATNIKQLFCQKGINDRFVLALDPGFLTCKCAFLEPTGKIITTCEFRYQQGKAGGFDRKGTEYITHCLKMTNGMNLAIAIGNGKGSYETQKIVSQLISSTLKYNKIDIGFCIVPEDGASKYSITELAAIEMPEISPNERSAVSIGRRLIDPMSEYVKIEPRHLGKGMYQHSVNSTKLTEALELVVKERVSLRGVDVNCASEHLLRQVCGLNKRTAAGIVTLREKLGKITSREEIRKVAGLGPISFVQCSGFLRVLKPEKSYVKNGNKRRKVEWNPLDETVIHPDDYGIAEKVLKKIGILTMEEEICWQDVKKKIANIGRNVKWEEGEQKIVDLLLIEEDLIEPPRLMKCVTKNVELRKGAILPGIIRNQTTFGVFVDIGLETNGLAHISKFRYRNQLPAVGQNLNFRVLDFGNGRISLEPVY